MSMSAALFNIKEDGTAQKVTLHWSTVLDATFGHFIASSRHDGIAPKDALRTLVEASFAHHHLSNIEIADPELAESRNFISIGYGVRLVAPYGDKPEELDEADVDSEMLSELEEGSIGAVAYEEFPELVTFCWINPVKHDLDSFTININKLADFYENLESEQKLMPILARDEWKTKPFAV